MSGSHCKSTTYDECALQCAQENLDQGHRGSPRFINPHRLFHGVWLPQWLEERQRFPRRQRSCTPISPISRVGRVILGRHSGFGGETTLFPPSRDAARSGAFSAAADSVTNVNNPERGHCANYYRSLWHPWMQSTEDANFCMAVQENEAPFEESEITDTHGDMSATLRSDINVTPSGDANVTPPGDIHVTPW